MASQPENCIDTIIEQAVQLLQTALTIVRSGHSSPPTNGNVALLHDVTKELRHAADVIAAEAERETSSASKQERRHFDLGTNSHSASSGHQGRASILVDDITQQ